MTTLKNNHFRRMVLEGLETRKLMATDISVVGDVVEIRGDEQNNSAIIRESDGQLYFTTDQGTFIRASGTVSKVEFHGGDGDDVFENHTTIPAVANGDLGNDRLVGGAANDVLNGGKGNDIMEGRGGDDKLVGANGDDTYVFSGGNLGFDQVVDLAHENTLDFSEMDKGVKVSLRNPYKQTLNDDLKLKLGRDDAIDHVNGSQFNDRILGNDLPNNIHAGDGDDEILGFGGADAINGGKGDDVLQGDRGDDELTGGNGNDTYRFRNNGLGSDTIRDLAHENTLNFEGIGGGGIRISLSNPYMQKVNENLSLKLGRVDAIDHVFGTDAGDTIIGNDLDNKLYGGKGNDNILGRGGNDRLDGGKGADELFGGSGADRIFGGSGEDELFGGAGDDYLDGGSQADALYGEEGADEFRADDGDKDWIFFHSEEDKQLKKKDGKDQLWDEYNPQHQSKVVAQSTSREQRYTNESDFIHTGVLEIPPASTDIPETEHSNEETSSEPDFTTPTGSIEL